MDFLEQTLRPARQNIPLYKKIISLFSVVRGYNVAIVFIAQLLSAIFVFTPDKTVHQVLLDRKLWALLLATSFVIASGYIINHFYDWEKDAINKPIKTKIDSYISQAFKLKSYFTLNFMGFGLGFLVSWRAALFFAGYIFAIWFYSHKLKRYPLIGLLGSAILSILPFFALFAYYKNFTDIIFVHASFLAFVLIIKDLIKDLENLKGDMLFDYQTIVIKYGEFKTKLLVVLITAFSVIPIALIFNYPELGLMRYYFLLALFGLILVSTCIWFGHSKKRYVYLHNAVRLIIITGVFSLMLIDTSVLINRIIFHLT